MDTAVHSGLRVADVENARQRRLPIRERERCNVHGTVMRRTPYAITH